GQLKRLRQRPKRGGARSADDAAQELFPPVAACPAPPTEQQHEKGGDGEEPERLELRTSAPGGEVRAEAAAGEREQCAETEQAVDDEAGGAGGLAIGSDAPEPREADGVAGDAARKKGVVEKTDPERAMDGERGRSEALGAEEELPAPRLQRVGGTGKKRRAGDHGGVQLGKRGEVAPRDVVRQPEQGGEGEAVTQKVRGKLERRAASHGALMSNAGRSATWNPWPRNLHRHVSPGR